MRLFTDYRKFKKCVRKFWKRHATKRIDYIRGKRLVSYWTDKEFCYYLLNDSDEMLSNNAYNKYSFYYDIEESDFNEHIKEWSSLIGCRVTAKRKENDYITGVFDGFIITNNCVCFAVLDENTLDICRLPLCWTIEKFK